MPHTFEPSVVEAVLRHMNDDHVDDNILIVRAFGPTGDCASAVMTSFDGAGGEWDAVGPDGTVERVRVPWPGGGITERPAVRREIVALYDAACARLGVEPRPHA